MAFCVAIRWVANRDDTDAVPAVALARAVALDDIARRRGRGRGILELKKQGRPLTATA